MEEADRENSMCLRLSCFVQLVLKLSLVTSILGLLQNQLAFAQQILPAPSSQPIYAAVSAPVPRSDNWRGFYFGAHAGYGWRHVTSGVRTVLATGFVTPGIAFNTEGAFGGFQLGYNILLTPRIVAGIEADLSYGNIFGSLLPPIPTPNSTKVDGAVHWFGTVRARIGWTIHNALIYGTGGLAVVNSLMRRQQLTATSNGVPPGTIETSSYWNLGWTVGGGVEVAINPRWAIKAEYLYLASFGNIDWTPPIAQVQSTIDIRMHTTRIGLNYRF
jgi:outer membrane immunogenic protein